MFKQAIKKSFLVLIGIFIFNNVFAQLPDPGFKIDDRTAVVVTDPQNDFLSPDGAAWGAVGQSVKENNTIKHLDTVFKQAQKNGLPVFVSPHYYYKNDHKWKFEGALEVLMHNINMFDRKGKLTLEGFKGSGADFLPLYKKYIKKIL